jgi:hypothetical protein
MKPYVDLYGGYDPADWKRDLTKHASVIDGEQVRRPVVGADHSRIDGFVIRNGKSAGPGGAILCQRCSPVIANNIIVDNLALEPADYIYGMFHQVGNDGGGIACNDGANPLISNNIIARNKTNIGNGGGIAARNLSLPIIENNIICENRTGLKDNDPDKKKRARSSNGAGISLSNSASLEHRARIANNVISGNRVGGNSDAGGIYCEYDSSPEILHNYLLNNTCEDDGGAIYVMKLSDPFISGNTFAGNNGGGTVRLSKEGRGHIHNNLFFSNPAGGFTCVDAWMVFSNNTIVDNPNAGGVINRHFLSMKPPVFINNLFYNNTGSSKVGVESPDAPQISHCNIQGGSPGDSNFDADPKLVRDGTKGEIKSVAYDENRVQTRVVPAAPIQSPQAWVGRVIHVGAQWSVIAAASENELVAWGDLRNADAAAAKEYEIASTYRMPPDSPCAGKGMKIPVPLMGDLAPLPEAGPETMVNVGATLTGVTSTAAGHTAAASH